MLWYISREECLGIRTMCNKRVQSNKKSSKIKPWLANRHFRNFKVHSQSWIFFLSGSKSCSLWTQMTETWPKSQRYVYLCLKTQRTVVALKTLSHVHAVVAPGFCIGYLRCVAVECNGWWRWFNARSCARGQMQLHALTGSHQEEAAVNSNSLWMVMELTVFVGRGREEREELQSGVGGGGVVVGWTKVIRIR